MIKYDDNSGRISFELKFSFSPRSWWGHTKYWFRYLTDKKRREFERARRKAWEEAWIKIVRDAEFAALFGMTREEWNEKYRQVYSPKKKE